MAIVGDILSSEPRESYFIPPSTVFSYAGTSVTTPDGWLFCDGSSYGTATYPDLFAVIGYSYGGSGGSFSVPDLRGRVVAGRDIDNGAGTAGRLSTVTNQGTVVAVSAGAQTHTLGTAEIPAHHHGAGTISSGVTNNTGGHVHTGSIDPANTDHTHQIVNTYGAENDNWANVFRRRTPTSQTNLALNAPGSGTSTIVIAQASSGMSLGNMNTNQSHSHSLSINSSGAHEHTVSGSVVSGTAGGGGAHNNLQPTMIMNYIIKT